MKRYRVVSCEGAIPDWEKAEALTGFTFPWEERPAPRTEFRALWKGEAFHFRFDCDDDDLVLADGASAMEKVIGSDRVEIFLARDLGLNPYYGLEMDPRGEVLAYEGRYHRQFDWEWECAGLELIGEPRPGGYRVEGAIPLETLRELKVLKDGSGRIHAGVYRAEFSHGGDGIHEGWMAWVDPQTETPDFHVPGSFGMFELVSD